MADGGFDPCECVWSHEGAMQRLLNMLRNSQNQCSDTECFQNPPGPTGTPGDGGYSMMMVMLGWLVVATALFLLRPQSLRRVTGGDQKPSRNGQNDDNQSPPPPPPGIQ
ncbi:DgyrCDS14187 [Dimorphilus gyrociliatus]|uniref:Small integral membrane protein 14 n=1 Tax=Dimorphilus gyrociliatus TaxID=2664684 RepID=A0A7I8WD19_9ANNE|nr:DgyrCDS14187 [Dimorphilus gyrociliatus]